MIFMQGGVVTPLLLNAYLCVVKLLIYASTKCVFWAYFCPKCVSSHGSGVAYTVLLRSPYWLGERSLPPPQELQFALSFWFLFSVLQASGAQTHNPPFKKPFSAYVFGLLSNLLKLN